MYIDVFSLILGAVVWEVLSYYLKSFIRGVKIGYRRKMNELEQKKAEKNYVGTNIGFTAKLDKEETR